MNAYAALVCASLTSVALGGVSDKVAEFSLSDHPDGSAAEPYYGLRLDNITEPGTVLLSMDHYADTVLSVYDDGGSFSIHITGTLYGGAVSSHEWVDAQSYAVDFWYTANVSEVSDGWEVTGMTGLNAGTITNLDTDETTDLYGKPNNSGLAFAMREDGHRVPGNDTWVGRGWLTDESDFTDPGAGYQDWLFVAVERPITPTPSSAMVLAAAGLGLSRRRR